MAIATTCPKCDAVFRLADTLAGKRVQCQKCMARFIVPSAGIPETQPGTLVEAISRSAPAKTPSDAPPKAVRRKPAPTEPEEPKEMDVEEADEAPRRKRRDETDDEDEEDERPRRKRRDETDDDEDERRPRRRAKKRRKAAGSSTPMILAIAGACVVLLLCCGGVGTFALMGSRNPDGGGGTAVAFGPDGVFRSESSLRIWDPTKDRRHFRLYTMPVEPGKTYDIDMSSRTLDSFLVLLDEKNLVVAQDDDGGGNLNAHITFRADRAATFRIEASTFDDHETGNFTLIVRRR